MRVGPEGRLPWLIASTSMNRYRLIREGVSKNSDKKTIWGGPACRTTP